MGFGTFMFWQVVSTGLFMAWYAKRHPSDAMQLMMRFRSLFARRA